MKAIGFSEHGNIHNWIDKKQYCDKKGIKYLHGCEVYLTEKLLPKERDNYHTVLIARNFQGVLELNKLISKSTDENHFYYKPRISFDEFLNISDNIISTSACLASPLSRLSEDNTYYNKLVNKYTFLEIQPHIHESQLKYNLKLIELSKKFNKSLIVGTDTHALNKYKSECRSILQKAKRIQYTDEDKFDLTFKTTDRIIELFEQQGLNKNIYIKALENTNNLYNMIEDFTLDKSLKYPNIYKDINKTFKNIIQKKYIEKVNNNIINDNKIYKQKINEEYKVFKKLGMFSFMLFMSELITWCHENDIPTGFCRGSVGGSVIAYILDIIDLNPIQWNTVFSRFANEDRVSLGDIDIDFSPSDRVKVYNYIIERFGQYGDFTTCYILTTHTISDKGTIDEIGRALNFISNGEKYDLRLVEKIKKEYDEDPETTKEKYQELFYYFDGLKGTVVSQGYHPAGIVASTESLNDHIGLFKYDDKWISQINMDEIHDLNYVKYDILGLKNIGIIKDTYKLLNSHYLKSNEINWNDKNVWNDIIKSPVGIFQFEGRQICSR
jgi:DNA polymerase-3 subunit alpha